MKIKILYRKYQIKYYNFLIKRINNKHAKHVIKKFGKYKARKYAYSTHSCPCYALKMKCRSCKYADKKEMPFALYQGCSPGREWVYLSQHDINLIKNKIKELIKRNEI